MSVVIPVGEAQASFVFNCSGIVKDMTWTLGVKSTGAIITPSAIAEAVYDAITDNTDPRGALYKGDTIQSGWTFQGVSVSLMTATGPLVGQHIAPITHSGAATQAVPPNCTWLATKSTALGGRKNKGRAYLVPMGATEADVNSAGVLSDVPRTIMNDSLALFLENLAAVDIVPLLHHSDGSAGTEIDSIVVGNLIATQRRRLR